MSVPDRRAKLDRKHGKLSIRRQCALLGIARSGVYRPERAANDNDLGVMRRLDELFTQWPILDSRRLARMLHNEGHVINRKCVQRLMRQMSIAALGPKPRTSKPAGHKVYPYLLRDLVIDRPIRCGRPTSPTFRSGAGSCTWWRSWIGRAARC
jgi:putative transposase